MMIFYLHSKLWKGIITQELRLSKFKCLIQHYYKIWYLHTELQSMKSKGMFSSLHFALHGIARCSEYYVHWIVQCREYYIVLQSGVNITLHCIVEWILHCIVECRKMPFSWFTSNCGSGNGFVLHFTLTFSFTPIIIIITFILIIITLIIIITIIIITIIIIICITLYAHF